jgi:hypothetical protein
MRNVTLRARAQKFISHHHITRCSIPFAADSNLTPANTSSLKTYTCSSAWSPLEAPEALA